MCVITNYEKEISQFKIDYIYFAMTNFLLNNIIMLA
jgi:hypothetical protein